MKIGNKITVMLLILLGYWVIFSVIIAITLLYPDYKKIEEKQISESIERAKASILHKQANLVNITTDLAHWDSSVEFITGKSKNYIEKNLPPNFFKIYNIDNMIFFDKDNNLFWNYKEAKLFLSADIIKWIANNNNNKSKNSIALTPEGIPFIFAISNILNNNENPKSYGKIVTIQIIDNKVIAKLNKISSEFFSIKALKEKEVIFQTKNKSGYLITTTPIIDYKGKKIATLRIITDGNIEKLRKKNLRSFILSMGGTVILITILQAFLLNRLVTNRLTLFKNHIKNINLNKKTPLLISKKRDDEIDELTVEFNSIIRKLQSTQRQKALLQQKLHHSQKMEAIGQLAGGVAHIFNNNLQVIMGFTEMLKKNQEYENDLDQLDMILKASHHCVLLTNKMLAFSKSGKRDETEFFLHDLINNATNIMQEENSSSIVTIITERTPEIPIRGDFMQLQNVLINILINAHEAIEKEGIIEISTDTNKKNVVISIKDNGKGIPEEIISEIFNPFFSTKDLSYGAGMGLAESYAIIHNHNGSIECQSKVGVGTIFKIKLPKI